MKKAETLDALLGALGARMTRKEAEALRRRIDRRRAQLRAAGAQHPALTRKLRLKQLKGGSWTLALEPPLEGDDADDALRLLLESLGG